MGRSAPRRAAAALRDTGCAGEARLAHILRPRRRHARSAVAARLRGRAGLCFPPALTWAAAASAAPAVAAQTALLVRQALAVGRRERSGFYLACSAEASDEDVRLGDKATSMSLQPGRDGPRKGTFRFGDKGSHVIAENVTPARAVLRRERSVASGPDAVKVRGYVRGKRRGLGNDAIEKFAPCPAACRPAAAGLPPSQRHAVEALRGG
ncbi:MAG: hypothetical protein GY772_19755, partial [bacterium]|nr:hypothetical protein [bacterium]